MSDIDDDDDEDLWADFNDDEKESEMTNVSANLIEEVAHKPPPVHAGDVDEGKITWEQPAAPGLHNSVKVNEGKDKHWYKENASLQEASPPALPTGTAPPPLMPATPASVLPIVPPVPAAAAAMTTSPPPAPPAMPAFASFAPVPEPPKAALPVMSFGSAPVPEPPKAALPMMAFAPAPVPEAPTAAPLMMPFEPPKAALPMMPFAPAAEPPLAAPPTTAAPPPFFFGAPAPAQPAPPAPAVQGPGVAPISNPPAGGLLGALGNQSASFDWATFTPGSLFG